MENTIAFFKETLNQLRASSNIDGSYVHDVIVN